MKFRVGGSVEGRVATFVPCKGWEDARMGDLVRSTTGANYEMIECRDGEIPDGVVVSVNLQKDVLGVELFTSGCIIRIPYTGEPQLGASIACSSNNTVKDCWDDPRGTGIIIAVDAIVGFVDVLFL
jgi:hypothetical protein